MGHTLVTLFLLRWRIDQCNFLKVIWEIKDLYMIL